MEYGTMLFTTLTIHKEGITLSINARYKNKQFTFTYYGVKD